MPIPDAPSPVPAKSSAPARPKGMAPVEHDTADIGYDAVPQDKGVLPWGLIFGVACVILLVLTLVFWGKVGSRDKSIAATKNRTEQVEAAGVVMKAELDESRAVSARLQQQLDETKAEAAQGRTALAEAKNSAGETQAQLEKTRTGSADFQTQLTEAKVTSIQDKAAATKALGLATVAQTDLTKARADLADLQTQLTESRNQAAELQRNLDTARIEIGRMQKPAAKK